MNDLVAKDDFLSHMFEEHACGFQFTQHSLVWLSEHHRRMHAHDFRCGSSTIPCHKHQHKYWRSNWWNADWGTQASVAGALGTFMYQLRFRHNKADFMVKRDIVVSEVFPEQTTLKIKASYNQEEINAEDVDFLLNWTYPLQATFSDAYAFMLQEHLTLNNISSWLYKLESSVRKHDVKVQDLPDNFQL